MTTSISSSQPHTNGHLLLHNELVHVMQLPAQISVVEGEVADVTLRLGSRHQLNQR